MIITHVTIFEHPLNIYNDQHSTNLKGSRRAHIISQSADKRCRKTGYKICNVPRK